MVEMTAAASSTSEVVNTTIRLADYRPHPKNYNHHPAEQIAQIAASLRQFGQVRSIVVWHDYIIAGHGVTQAAQSLGWQTLRADILPDDWPEDQALAYLIADNETRRRANPDQMQLAAILDDLQKRDPQLVKSVGISGRELQQLLQLVDKPQAGADTEPQIDRAEELRQQWQVEPGQLWALGDHRLICGDCTDAAVVARVMGGEKADMVFTDPPYGIEIVGGNGKIGASNLAENHTYAAIVNDDTTETARAVYEMMKPTPMILWGGNYFTDFLPPRACWLIWDKREGMASNNFADCEIAWTSFQGPARIYRHLWSGMIRKGSDGEKWHPTQKPVDLHVSILRDFSEDGTVVYEPFLGSGTTLIACENLGRRCRAVEISPAYVAVALQRYFDATGKQPELIGAGDAR